jgi:tripartite-type tricarboxylate transporter receptor subunit TctC
MTLFRLVACAALMLLQIAAAAAQDFPTRHITAIVPFAAGNSVDIVGRLLAGKMSELLGQQVIVENIGGAGGSIGTTRAARAAPDGYTLVIGGTDTFAQGQSLLEKPPYNSATDFVPIVLAVDLPIVMTGRNGLPPNNLKELIAYMKANQDKLQFGSSGIGGATHLACAQVLSAIGVTLAQRGCRHSGHDLRQPRPLLSGGIRSAAAHRGEVHQVLRGADG